MELKSASTRLAFAGTVDETKNAAAKVAKKVARNLFTVKTNSCFKIDFKVDESNSAYYNSVHAVLLQQEHEIIILEAVHVQ